MNSNRFSLIVAGLLLLIACELAVIYFQLQSPPPEKKVNTLPSPALPYSVEMNTYYIDRTKGNNRNPGTDKTLPWQDFSILKEKRFGPGVRILLKRGETWHQTLVTPNGGSGDRPIVIDAYGTGSPPVINLGNRVKYGVQINHSHTQVHHIDVTNAANNGIAVVAYGNDGCRGVRLNHLNITHSGKNGISVHKGGSDLWISHCTIEHAQNNGIHLGGSPESKLSNVVVDNCTIKWVQNNDGITIHEDSQGNEAGSGFLLENNTVEFCGEQGFDITSGNNILLRNNKSENNALGGVVVGHQVHDVTIMGHESVNEPVRQSSAAINFGGKGRLRLLKSLIRGNGYHLLLIRTSNVAVYNNTFVWDGGTEPIDLQGPIDNIYFINNIVYAKQPAMDRIRFHSPIRPPNHPSFHFDHNIYYSPDHQVVFHHSQKNYDFKQYRETFQVEPNSSQVDPAFLDPAQERYQLKPGSPAVDKGGFLTSITGMENEWFQPKDPIFFFTVSLSESVPCVMFQDHTDRFRILGIDPLQGTVRLDRVMPFPRPEKVGLCYNGSAMDIGKFEQ